MAEVVCQPALPLPPGTPPRAGFFPFLGQEIAMDDGLLDFPEIDLSLDLGDFDLGSDFDTEVEFETRYIKPRFRPGIPEEHLAYKNAEALAAEMVVSPGSRHYIIVDGSFYFGDFIEALVVQNDWHIPEMTVSTLSMNQNNVDSLRNLMTGGYVERLNLIVSAYFYSHERSSLIKYIYKQLDIGDRFQLAAASSHCKLVMFRTDCGLSIVMHGSANLRSSSNIEQLMVEDNTDLYRFNSEIHSRIIETYKTINHQVRRNLLWSAVIGDANGGK